MTCLREVAGGENAQAPAAMVMAAEGQAGAGAEMPGDDAITDNAIGI